ncbi:HEPN domain-containing protein [Litoribacter populi]|uniref:HEPN domain-containing protein n=1 Tax=Litoribacter populi TaxID=2598460 RepID=UPI00117F9DE9|nr:HEPN domain-containing protein [Litoribacter populi]
MNNLQTINGKAFELSHINLEKPVTKAFNFSSLSSSHQLRISDRVKRIEEEEVLHQLTKALIILVNPDDILLLEQPGSTNNEPSFKQVYVVLPPTEMCNKDMLLPYVEFLISRRFNFSIQLIDRSQVFSNFENADLFFQILHPQFQVLYSRPGLKPYPETITKELTEAKAVAKRRFDIHVEKSQTFLDLSDRARHLGQNGLSAYLLHQSLELLLRGLIKAWGKKEKKTHDLKTLILHCKRWIPLLYNLFPEEPDILKQLNNSYIDARYNQGFTISDDILEAARSSAVSLLSYTIAEMNRVLA